MLVHKNLNLDDFVLLIWFINILGDFYSLLFLNMLTIMLMVFGRN